MVNGLSDGWELVRLVHRRAPRIAERPPRVWRSDAREVPVDPGGRAGRGGSLLALTQVDLGHLVQAEDDIVFAIDDGRAQRHGLAAEGFADGPFAPAKRDFALALDLAHDGARAVVDRRQLLGEGSIARPIAARRRRQAESLMRPLGVVDMAEALELLIALRQIAPRPLSDHLALHGAIEALDLALGLGMVGPAMAHADAQAQQPGPEPRPRLVRAIAPGRAIVHQHATGQPIA